jgi:hypothetical protein
MAKASKLTVASERPGRLKLGYAQVETELTAFRPLARHCLTDTSVQALDQWLADLVSTASIKSERVCTVKTSSVLSTRSNDGKHQKASSVSLFGEIEFTWDIIPEAPKSKLAAAKHFLLENASIRLAICEQREAGGHDTLASWTFDIGNQESPGCHFHAKYDDAGVGASTNIDIPRLPTLVVMPTDAMAFLFGELWQKQWSIDLVTDLRDPASRWRSWPRDRLAAVLSAFVKCINEDTGLIPWAAFKAYKPGSDLLLK